VAHGLITKEPRRKDGRQTSNQYHLHVGAKPKRIEKRRDTLRRAKEKTVQDPNFGASAASSSHRNSEPGLAQKFGPELYPSEVWDDGECSSFQPGVKLHCDDLTSSPLVDGRDGLEWHPIADDAAGTNLGLVDNSVATPSRSAEVPDLLERHTVDVVDLPPGQTRRWTFKGWHGYFDERAGIAEYDWGLARGEAEAQAFDDCVAEWLDQRPTGSAHNRGLAVAALMGMGLITGRASLG
jgi:hypothetical protein